MQECGTEDSLLQAQYVDVNLYLAGDILTKVDRTSMAHSLEVRAPFLDYEFVEWGMRLPAALKLRGKEGKWVAQEGARAAAAARDPLPPQAGFRDVAVAAVPRAVGRAAGPAAGAGRCWKADCSTAAALGQLVDEHASARFDHSGALWLLLAFEGFLQQQEAAERPAMTAEAA